MNFKEIFVIMKKAAIFLPRYIGKNVIIRIKEIPHICKHTPGDICFGLDIFYMTGFILKASEYREKRKFHYTLVQNVEITLSKLNVNKL